MVKLRNSCGCTITDETADTADEISGNARHLLDSGDWEVVENGI